MTLSDRYEGQLSRNIAISCSGNVIVAKFSYGDSLYNGDVHDATVIGVRVRLSVKETVSDMFNMVALSHNTYESGSWIGVCKFNCRLFWGI